MCGILIGLRFHPSKQVVLAVEDRNKLSVKQNTAYINGQSCMVL